MGTSRPQTAIIRTAVLILALLAGGLLSVLVGSAGAGPGRHGQAKPILELITPALGARSVGRIDVDTLGQRTCSLSFSGPRHRHAGPFVVRARRRHVQWSWRVPATVARGRWAAVVACAPSRSSLASTRAERITARLVVRGGLHRGTTIVAHGSLRVQVTAAAPGGQAAATGGKVIGVGGAHNPFPAGQCTYQAYGTRPDIYDYAIAHGVRHSGVASGARYGGIPDYWWNAWRWLANAQRVGFPTGTTPVVGALVVFPRGYGGSAVGHVAYVKQVNADGTYVVSERNWNYNPNITLRLVHLGYRGVGFIYGGPAGPGPTTTTPTTTSTPTTTTTTTTTGTTTTTTTTTAPPPTSYVHHVRGTCADGSCGLHDRTGPGYSNYAIVGTLHDGDELDIVCQTTGEFVAPNRGTGSNVWDKLTNGYYVTDVYVDTSGVGGAFSPPIPRC